MKKIGLITTLDTNIGDDFIREGVLLLLERIFRKNINEIDIVAINKHRPFSIFQWNNPFRLIEYFPIGKNFARSILEKTINLKRFNTLFDDRDIIIQCGTPVFWPGCSHAEWVNSIWYTAIDKNINKIKCYNIAAGSAYPWEKRNKIIINKEDEEFIKNIVNYCDITIVRDQIAKNILEQYGYNVDLLPCTAFFSGKRILSNIDLPDDIILINYMEKGGHYDWGQNINTTKWLEIIKKFIRKYHNKYKIVFLAHNKEELELSYKLDNTASRFLPKNVQEYFNLVKHAKVAICNRMHASVALASIGIPSVAIGTDTRLKMVEQIGLPIFYVKDISFEILEETVFYLWKNFNNERERLFNLRDKSFDAYLFKLNELI